jgi:outer membrane protein assembly factor BamA
VKTEDKKVSFSLFPAPADNSSGRLLVTTFNATFLLGDPKTTNYSTVYFIPYITFNNQFGVELYPTIWLKNNSWNFKGEYYILDFSQDTWGVGGDSDESNKVVIENNRIRIHQYTLKGIFPNIAVGLGYQYDKYYNIVIPDDTVSSDSPYYSDLEKGETLSSGIAFPIVYDSRKNIVNPQKGFYTAFTYRNNNTALGSDNNWQSVFIDARKYFPIANTRNILAFRSYYWSVISGDAPYFDLPTNGAEPTTGRAARGLQKERYRSNAILYFENEYRFNITRDGFIGGVAFANVISPSQFDTQCFKYWHPSVGVGVRLKFNKYTKVNLDADVGFSKDYVGFYFNIGEVF